MGKKRSTWEMLIAVLSACKKPIMKTDIMYQAKLTHNKLNSILTQAEQHGLLTKKGDKYRTTERGLNFIKDWKHLLDYFKKEEN